MGRGSVGILGGTFNPIHDQHILLAKSAYEQLSLSRVILMPSGVSYLKRNQDVLPSDQRYEMCLLAAEDISFLEVSDMEIKRSGNSYTRDTIKQLLQDDPSSTYYFITGTDTFFMLDKWKDPEYIFSHCIIAVAQRADAANRTDTDLIRKIREYEGRYNAAIRTLDIRISDLSSSTVRDYIAEGRDIRSFVPDKVAKYIKENGLYR